MEYHNFELRIGARNEGRYPVAVIRSPAGETSTMVSLPVDDPAFQAQLAIIEKSRKQGKTRNASHPTGNPARDVIFPFTEDFKSVRTLGQELFERLFTAEVRSCFRSSLQRAREDKKGLRVRLRIETPELATLPWEYLFDATEGDFLCLSTETPLIRFLELARPPTPLTVAPPLNILGMVASPSGLPALDVEREKAQMAIALEPLVDRGFFNLTWLDGQSWRDLQSAMRKGPWHILHFIGHGGFNPETREGAIALADADGSTYHLAAKNLGRLLAGHPTLRLIVLNSCEGARAGTDDLFSSAGAGLIRRGIPAVVSMQYEISDRAALEFSRTFYETVGEGIPVDTAVQEARKALSFAFEGSPEWGTPILHMRSPDGRLFDLDMMSAIFGSAATVDQPPPAKIPDPAPARTEDFPLDTEDFRGLKALMKKVRQFWVEGVLEPPIRHSALIDLGLDNLPQMVESPWGEMPISAEQSIGAIFDEVGRSLLLLGEPGAGKTTLLLTLARELLDKYETTPGLPLPVVFNLSSWTHSGKKLNDWLADELGMKYLIPRKIGEQWLRDQRLLLFLDGLDEVGALRRNDCVKAINTFLSETALTGMVVCCRFREYIELPTKLTVNSAIRLRQLSREKVLNHLAGAGAAYNGLRALLQKDPSFLQLAETPFMLSLMMQTYEHIDPDQLAGGGFQSIDAKKRQLMDAYVQRRFRMIKTGDAL